MTGASEILAELQSRGIHFERRPHGGVRLVPARLIDSDLLNRIHAHKAALLAALRAQQEQAESDRIARLDAERCEADRQARRGYDFDPTAPSHAEYLPDGHPAFSILETCQRYGVALRIDSDGTLVVGKAGAKAEDSTQPWPSLMMALEAHLDDVKALVDAGWTLKAGFPNTAASANQSRN